MSSHRFNPKQRTNNNFAPGTVFKISIPEEFTITGTLDPTINDKFGHVLSCENDIAVFEVLKKNGLEKVEIPMFCLQKYK